MGVWQPNRQRVAFGGADVSRPYMSNNPRYHPCCMLQLPDRAGTVVEMGELNPGVAVGDEGKVASNADQRIIESPVGVVSEVEFRLEFESYVLEAAARG